MKNFTRYTWKTKYILPYESKWSLREKFCFLNGYTYSLYKKANIGTLSSEYKVTNTCLNQITTKEFISPYIRICPKCMEYGYHSNIHQNLLYTNCYVHKDISLTETDIPYEISNIGNPLYEFFYPEGNICNIIKNDTLLKAIERTLTRSGQQIKRIKILSYNIVSYNNIVIPYKSTQSQFQSIISNSTKIVSHVKLICKVEKNNLEKLWKELMFNTMENIYKANLEERGYLNDYFTLEGFIRHNMQEKEDKLIVRYCEFDALLMIDLIQEYIKSIGGKDYYRKYYLELQCTKTKKRYLKEIARIMAIYSITTSLSPYFYRRMFERWGIASDKCPYSINVRSSIDYDFKYQDYLISNYREVFIYSILKDVFMNLSKEILSKLKNGEIDYTKDLRWSNFTPEVPQYIFLERDNTYYIYSCVKNI